MRARRAARTGCGRDVPVTLHRAASQLEFTATLALEDLDPALLADLDDLEDPTA